MTDRNILHLLVPEELSKRIDDYRFKHRFETKAEAVRFLLEWALKQNPKPGV